MYVLTLAFDDPVRRNSTLGQPRGRNDFGLRYCQVKTCATESLYTSRDAVLRSSSLRSRVGPRRLNAAQTRRTEPPSLPPSLEERATAAHDGLETDTQTDMLLGEPKSAICVQRFDDSLNSAIHTTYRTWLRSSSMHEPRDPPLKVVSFSSLTHIVSVHNLKCICKKTKRGRKAAVRTTLTTTRRAATTFHLKRELYP